MDQMTTQERFTRMFNHHEADRVPLVVSPWGPTIERWRKEGMPSDTSFVDYFDLDHVATIPVDNGPQFPTETIEETKDYRIYTTSWGVTLKNWKHMASTPEYLDFTIQDRDSWETAKQRMAPSHDRIEWDHLEENYPRWRKHGRWIQGLGWFGFDITHSRLVGTETLLIALAQDPEWCREMFMHELEVNLTLLEMVWEAGYEFDCLRWPDDMGYKQHQFFSVDTYRAVLKPAQKRAIDWAHEKGIKTELHSCGDIGPFVPELVDVGLDCLNPLEVKAGMDPVALKEEYGDKLAFHGGINAVLWDKPEQITQEMRRVMPKMKEGGGYIFSSDHSVPSSVSLKDFRHIVKLARELGSY